MHIPRGWIVLTLAAALASACSEHNTPTAVSESSPAPAFNFGNGPDSPGNSGVVRATYDGGYSFWLIDTERLLWAEVSNDPAGHCGVATAPVTLEYQISGWTWLAQGQEDFYARVWDASEYQGEPFCAWIDGRPTLAEGRVRFHEIAAGNKDDFMGTGRIARTDGQGDTNLRAVFSWDWPKWGDIVGVRAHTVHLGPDPRNH